MVKLEFEIIVQEQSLSDTVKFLQGNIFKLKEQASQLQ